jgi:hypothetical protein
MRAARRIVAIEGPFQAEPLDLFVYLDETGEESLSDPARRMFGFGGCAVTQELYHEVLASPWRSLKRQHFGSDEARLHAAKTKMTQPQTQAVGDYFRQQPFFRLAAVVTPSTKIDNIEDVHDAACYAVQIIVGRIVEFVMPNRVVFFYEDSERGNPLVIDRFGPLRLSKLHEDGHHEPIPIVHCFTPKHVGSPALEIADFIAHAAGCQASNHERGDRGWRKDFSAVFQSVDIRLAHYAHVREMGRVRVPSRPGHETEAT